MTTKRSPDPVLDAFGRDRLAEALELVRDHAVDTNRDLVEKAAAVTEIAALHRLQGEADDPDLEALAADTFDLRAHREAPGAGFERAMAELSTLAQGLVAGSGDLAAWIGRFDIGADPPDSRDVAWDEYFVRHLLAAWVRMTRSAPDDEAAFRILSELYAIQPTLESTYLADARGEGRERQAAIRLVPLYHAAQASHDIASWRTCGQPENVAERIAPHFRQALSVADPATGATLLWLRAAAQTLIDS